MKVLRRKDEASGEPGLLVDHWYSHAVGHVIEALRRCQGYSACDPDLRVSLVLNGASPTELALCAPFVAEAFGVPYTSFGVPVGSPRRALRANPARLGLCRPPSRGDRSRRSSVSRASAATTRRRGRHFRGRRARSAWQAGRLPPYAPHQKLRLALPEREREAALRGARRTALGRGDACRERRAGTSTRRRPRGSSMLDALERRFPDAAFVLVGRLGAAAAGRRVGSGAPRSSACSRRVGRGRRVRSADPRAARRSSRRRASSSHRTRGSASRRVAVGTPWLTLSGGDWHEYFFNGVPFHSVLPEAPTTPLRPGRGRCR